MQNVNWQNSLTSVCRLGVSSHNSTCRQKLAAQWKRYNIAFFSIGHNYATGNKEVLLRMAAICQFLPLSYATFKCIFYSVMIIWCVLRALSLSLQKPMICGAWPALCYDNIRNTECYRARRETKHMIGIQWQPHVLDNWTYSCILNSGSFLCRGEFQKIIPPFSLCRDMAQNGKYMCQ